MRKKTVEKLIKEAVETQRKEGLIGLGVVVGISAVGHLIQSRKIKKMKGEIEELSEIKEEAEEE